MPQKKKKKPQKRRSRPTPPGGRKTGGRSMTPNLELIPELKTRMITGKSFADSWDFFLDHFGENPAFMMAGEVTENELVAAVLGKIAQELYGPEARVHEPMFTAIPEHHFIHGGCFLHRRFGALFYFTDINQGILALPASRPSEETLFMRLTSYVFSGKDGPPNVVIPKTDYVQ